LEKHKNHSKDYNIKAPNYCQFEDLMLLHPHSIDREEIELESFLLAGWLASVWMAASSKRRIGKINQCNEFASSMIFSTMNYWLLIYSGEIKIL